MSGEVVRHEPDSARPSDVFRHYIGDIVYGANDGLVTTFTVVSGVAGADLSATVIVIIGFVNLIADGFSMGASNYLSIRSQPGAHGIQRGVREPLFHALATFGSFVVVGAVPLIPYVVPVACGQAFAASAVSTGGAMFTVGALRSLVTGRPWLRCGLEMLAIGALAAAVAFGVGSALKGLVS